MLSRLTFFGFLCFAIGAHGNQVLDSRMHPLRWGDAREWSDFPANAEAHELIVKFDTAPNPTEQTIRLRHRDLKQIWSLKLNGKELGPLPRDENEMVTYWSVPAGLLKASGNELRVECPAKVPAVAPAEGGSDDVMVGEVELINKSRKELLHEGSAAVTVSDAGKPAESLPCRITVVNEQGSLTDLGNTSDAKTAVRPGVVYSADGKAELHLPAGKYTIYAGRGFAYGVDSAKVDLKIGDSKKVELKIRREVQLDGYVSTDTHIHTFTYSHHGDATLDERLITLAGEDIQLPIATDHNLTVDYSKRTKELGLDRYFTPVIGEEVTTAKLGHFNVFPLTMDGPLPDWRLPTWKALDETLGRFKHQRVVILNHARDIHGGFRPFDPSRHLSHTGEDLDGWEVPANAMEVINSGATLTDPMSIYRDWFGMLNRGQMLTPIGASDSHDVSRFIVGQARTYVRADSRDDVHGGINSFIGGRVLVSYGLVADLKVAGEYGPGDLVRTTDLKDKTEIKVSMRVLGPSWSRADHVTLFANGDPVFEADIATPAGRPEPGGVKWEKTIKLPLPQHDIWLAVIATGPGVTAPYWPLAKSYQPTSPDWKSYVIGSSGVVRIDADGSGKFESARDYAQRIVENAPSFAKAVAELSNYDQATAGQTAVLSEKRWPKEFKETTTAFFPTDRPRLPAGILRYVYERQVSEEAKRAKNKN
jgi:hypothetical protein